MTISFKCPWCDLEFEVDATPGEQAVTWGPPENCTPGSADDFEPENCPGCGAKLDEKELAKKLEEKITDKYYDTDDHD